MKRLLALLLAVVLAFSFAACTSGGESSTSTPASTGGDTSTASTGGDTSTAGEGTAEVVLLVSAAGTLDDRAFNTACWAGVQEFCAETGTTYTYYQPTEDTVDAQLVLVETAVNNGAKFIIVNSDQFKVAAYYMQERYPDVTFIIYDTIPENEDGEQLVADNMTAITFAEEQCAYIAGYAAVKEGYTKLGYMGGMAVPAVVRFGYGFVAGADQAAQDLGVEGVEMMYSYFGNFEATPDNQAKIASWFQNGTEIIFVAAGPAGASAFAAAEQNDGIIIGVDSDQSGESETVISSAIKDLKNVTMDYLTKWKEGTLAGGETVRLTCADGGVALVMGENARWKTFSQEDYDAIYQKLADDVDGLASSIPNDTTYESAAEIPVKAITVTVVE